jgi:hypothetical protein
MELDDVGLNPRKEIKKSWWRMKNLCLHLV